MSAETLSQPCDNQGIAETYIRSNPFARRPRASTTLPREITDLDTLRTAIRLARIIAVIVYDRDGRLLAFVRLSKEEAHRCVIGTDRFDDFAAVLEGDHLTLNNSRVDGLRAQRIPFRRAQLHAADLANVEEYKRAGVSVPDYIEQRIAAYISANP